MPLFRLLARFKKLRGSALDIFGYTDERKMERALIADYERDIELILADLNPRNHAIAVEIASLPLEMRGFGHVKQANVEKASRRRDLLLRKLSGRDLAVELFNP